MINPEDHNQHIHPLIPSQFPEFVRVDHPTMVAFLSAYYEWLDTETDYLRSPMKLGSVIDVDRTLETFLNYFKNEYLLNFPKTLAIDKTTNKPVDERKLIKNIKSFYAAKGTEKTYEFLFRILYDTNVEFYYPKKDILRLSDGKWIAKKTIKTSALQGNAVFQAAGKNLVQRDASGNVLASARVIDVTTYQAGINSVAEFSLSGINGAFVAGNYGVEFTDSSGNKRNELRVFSVITSVTITNPGINYKVGDTVVFATATGDTGINASGIVQEVDTNTGAVKKIRIDNFGVNYNIAPTVSIQSFDGSGFAGTVTIGALAQYAGYYANNDSRLSTNKVLPDNQYYQNFSYVLQTEVTIDRYRDVLRKLLHPAGMAFFGSVLIKRCNYQNIDKTASLISYEVPLIGNYAAYTNNTYNDLTKWFVSASGDVEGYVPRVHDSAITGASGNPISYSVSYVKDNTEGGITGFGYLPSTSIPISRITSKTNSKISVGYHSILALSATGTVSNSQYTPDGAYTNWVNGLTGVRDIAAGLYYSVAILNNGSLTAGGPIWNCYTPTNGDTIYFSTTNTPIPSGTDFKQIDGGMVGAVGVRTNGSLVYWGTTNGSYQTGTNLLTNTMDWLATGAGKWNGGTSGTGSSVTVSLSSVTGPYHLAAGTTSSYSGNRGATAYQIVYATGLTTSAGQTGALAYQHWAFYSIQNREGFPVNISTTGFYISSVYVKALPGSSGQTIGLRGAAGGSYTKLTLNEEWQRLSTIPQQGYTIDGVRPAAGTTSYTTVFDLGIGNDPANGTTGCSVLVWGPQLEGPFSTSAGATTSKYSRVADHGVTASGGGPGWRVSQIPQGAGLSFDSVSLGRGKSLHAVGLLTDGGITAWGYNDNGQCNVPGDKNYKQVSASRFCTLALTRDGSITGWGYNGYGQLKVPSGKGYVSVDAGYFGACAIDRDGNTWFWGRTYSGSPAVPNGLSQLGTDIPGATGSTGFDGTYNYINVSPGIYPPGKWKFKQYQMGTYVSAGLFGAQELRTSGIGLSAAEPFWIVYQHPNQKIRDKVIARITAGQTADFSTWQEWTGTTSGKADWLAGFTSDSQYAVLSYVPEQSEFRKITARSFFNMPIGAEFNCKYDVADSVLKPYAEVLTLNKKNSPYDISFNANSNVTGGSTLTSVLSIKNPESIAYYGITYMVAELYWVSTDNQISRLLTRRASLAPTATTVPLSPPFSGLLSGGMFTNYPGNSGWITFKDGTQTQANGKYRLVTYYTDIAGKAISGTTKTTEFIYSSQ